MTLEPGFYNVKADVLKTRIIQVQGFWIKLCRRTKRVGYTIHLMRLYQNCVPQGQIFSNSSKQNQKSAKKVE